MVQRELCSKHPFLELLSDWSVDAMNSFFSSAKIPSYNWRKNFGDMRIILIFQYLLIYQSIVDPYRPSTKRINIFTASLLFLIFLTGKSAILQLIHEIMRGESLTNCATAKVFPACQ